MQDLGELLDLAAGLAETAGALLLAGLAGARDPIATKSTVTDLVTEFDRRSEQLIVEGILAVRPDDTIVGEEGTDHEGTSGVRWLIDPVDGTTNYHYGHPGFAVSIAAEIDGAPVVGVVADPVHDDLYTAAVGGGARCNGSPIAVSAKTDLATALVATGFSYRPERRARQAGVLTTVLPRVRDIRRMGAASVDLCSVATGRVDAYYERGLKPWDLAAGRLIATEAGALVELHGSGDGIGPLVIAAPPALFEDLRDLLLGAGAADA